MSYLPEWYTYKNCVYLTLLFSLDVTCLILHEL